jgi:hypothetical protein
LDLFDELLVNDVFETIDVKNLIGVFWLVQSQCQRRAASAAGIEKNPDGGDLFAFKVFSNLLGCCRGDFNHVLYPPW